MPIIFLIWNLPHHLDNMLRHCQLLFVYTYIPFIWEVVAPNEQISPMAPWLGPIPHRRMALLNPLYEGEIRWNSIFGPISPSVPSFDPGTHLFFRYIMFTWKSLKSTPKRFLKPVFLSCHSGSIIYICPVCSWRQNKLPDNCLSILQYRQYY